MPATDQLEQARTFVAQGAWQEANDGLGCADRESPLAADDLELWGMCAYMLGRDDEYDEHLRRAHELHLDAGATLRAARAAFWLGMNLLQRGEAGRGGGWIGRAQRLVDAHGGECVEQGHLMMPLAFRYEAMGELDTAAAIAGEAVAIGQRFGDPDLCGLGAQLQGRLLIRAGRIADGLALLDEAMLGVTAGGVSPIARGVVYCGVIMGCQAAYEVRRAQEWTAELQRWCARQPDMVAFSGRCHVHRAELMQLKGAWPAALEEARSAGRRARPAKQQRTLGLAAYAQGEVHRLRGAFGAAEEA